jgi:hypothetical protein
MRSDIVRRLEALEAVRHADDVEDPKTRLMRMLGLLDPPADTTPRWCHYSATLLAFECRYRLGHLGPSDPIARLLTEVLTTAEAESGRPVEEYPDARLLRPLGNMSHADLVALHASRSPTPES